MYVNYARVEDFDRLDELGVSVNGSIVIARYGKIFRGNKVLQEWVCGCRFREKIEKRCRKKAGEN